MTVSMHLAMVRSSSCSPLVVKHSNCSVESVQPIPKRRKSNVINMQEGRQLPRCQYYYSIWYMLSLLIALLDSHDGLMIHGLTTPRTKHSFRADLLVKL
jgi:hypothetical protein